jgi:hypothetical protein
MKYIKLRREEERQGVSVEDNNYVRGNCGAAL